MVDTSACRISNIEFMPLGLAVIALENSVMINVKEYRNSGGDRGGPRMTAARCACVGLKGTLHRKDCRRFSRK